MPPRRGPGHDEQVASHRDAAGHRRILRTLAAFARPASLAALLGACSTLPLAEAPAHLDHDVVGEFVVPPDGRLVLPASSHALVVHAFELQPRPLGEQFGAGARWFTFPPGTRVQVRGRFRTYADGAAPPASAERVLVGAVSLRAPDAP